MNRLSNEVISDRILADNRRTGVVGIGDVLNMRAVSKTHKAAASLIVRELVVDQTEILPKETWDVYPNANRLRIIEKPMHDVNEVDGTANIIATLEGMDVKRIRAVKIDVDVINSYHMEVFPCDKLADALAPFAVAGILEELALRCYVRLERMFKDAGTFSRIRLLEVYTVDWELLATKMPFLERLVAGYIDARDGTEEQAHHRLSRIDNLRGVTTLPAELRHGFFARCAPALKSASFIEQSWHAGSSNYTGLFEASKSIETMSVEFMFTFRVDQWTSVLNSMEVLKELRITSGGSNSSFDAADVERLLTRVTKPLERLWLSGICFSNKATFVPAVEKVLAVQPTIREVHLLPAAILYRSDALGLIERRHAKVPIEVMEIAFLMKESATATTKNVDRTIARRCRRMSARSLRPIGLRIAQHSVRDVWWYNGPSTFVVITVVPRK